MAPRWNSDGASLAVTNSTHDATTSDLSAPTSILPRRYARRMVKRSLTSRQSSRPNITDTGDDNRNSVPKSRNPFGCGLCNIRDNDPRVRYRGSWILNGTQQSTTHSTTTVGSTVTLRFNGTGVIVFGTVPASNETVLPPSVVYLLDANPPFATSVPFAAASIPNQPMFASGQLAADREHSLVINVTSAQSPYILSKFFVFPRPSASRDIVGQLPSDPLRGPGPLATATSLPPTPSPSSTSQTLSGNRADQVSQQAVRVLAGVLGMLAFLVIAAIIGYLLFRRRRLMAHNRLADEKGSTMGPQAGRRPETVYTSFTSPESILRNDGMSVWSPSRHSTRSHFSRFDGYRSEGRNTMDFAPPPIPPKPNSLVPSPNPVDPTRS